MKRVRALLLITASILTGCEQQEPVKTVDWYKANTSERLKTLERCKANPGELSISANCINASSAANAIVLEQRGYKRREPVNFSSQGK
jgi:hypothetical protein